MRRLDNVVVLRQNAETATEREWAYLLNLLVQFRSELRKLKFLVRTDGGGPNPQQRRLLEEALAGTPTRVAVVSDHLRVRFVTSTIALFQKDLKSFLVRELPDAYDHLNLSESERRQAGTALKEMDAELA